MIDVKDLYKSFDDFQALKGMSLHVNEGSVYGLCGVNGSGKTTLIKHLTGVLKQDSGSVRIDGKDVFENIDIKSRVGYIPDDLFFFGAYSLKGMRDFYRSIYPNWNDDRYKSMLADFGVIENKKISKLSKGLQKQAAFILTMSTMPDFLILDEPVDGLDPLVRHKLWKYVMEDVAERKMTALISSHNLRELEGVCDSVGMVSAGQMKLEGDVEELRTYIRNLRAERGEDPDSQLGLEDIFIYAMTEDVAWHEEEHTLEDLLAERGLDSSGKVLNSSENGGHENEK